MTGTRIDRVAREYQAAVVAAAQHQEAATLAAQTAAEAQAALAAIDPSHALLQLTPAELMDATAGLSLHPLQMLVELFLKPTEKESPPMSPSTALLAGSLAISRGGPATAPEILRRVMAITRQPLGLDR